MVGLALAKSLYALPTWTKVTALVAEHWKLQRVLGCEGDPPSKWAAYRFASKRRENGDKVERCIDAVVEGLKAKLPTYGRDLAIDASDMPAYANGQRFVSKDSEVERNWHTDPEARRAVLVGSTPPWQRNSSPPLASSLTALSMPSRVRKSSVPPNSRIRSESLNVAGRCR